MTLTESFQTRQYRLKLDQTRQDKFDIPTSIISSLPEETFALGTNLATILKKGSVIALKGPLGAGKTCLAKGIARGLHVEEELTSPTYTIISEYEGIISEDSSLKESFERKNCSNVRLYHIDAYRLGGNDDFSAIGGEEIVFGDGISIIEWSERIPGFIPNEAIRVDIGIQEDQKRHIRIYREEAVFPRENTK